MILIGADSWEIRQDDEPHPEDVVWLDIALKDRGVLTLPAPVLEAGVRIWIMKK